MPTRRITRSPVKVTGSVPDSQQFESLLEEDFYVLLRFNSLVESFEAQPVTIEWKDNTKKIRSYTPDVLVRYRKDVQESGSLPPVLCEIKPDFTEKSESPRRRGPPRKENQEENELKWVAAKRYAARQGWEFKVVRESDIRTPYLDNARFLLRHLERTQPSKYDTDLLDWLESRRESNLQEWASSLGGDLQTRATVIPACYRLIALGRVITDLSVRLTLVSCVKAVPNA